MYRNKRTSTRLAAALALALAFWVGSTAEAQQPAGPTFSHDTAAHKTKQCDDCHTREDDAISPRFPGHAACVSCHVVEFTSRSLNICAICHKDVKTVEPPFQEFSERKSFGVRFDSRAGGNQHEPHAGYVLPATGRSAECALCHKTKGAPMSFPGHSECYQCHSPGTASPASAKTGCITCHKPAGETEPDEMRTLASREGSAAYRYRFTHASHNRVTKNNCLDCHRINAGIEPGAPSLAVHRATPGGNSCFKCHNGGRAFGEQDFVCVRCHG